MKEIIVDVSGALSMVLAVGSAVPYILSILNGRTKPHQMTWLIFTIMNGIILTSQYAKGARASILISLVFFITTIINFLLSLRYGVRNTSRWDGFLFAFSLMTIVAWALTKSPSVAIWLTVVIDVFATTMMILKIKAHPGSEALLPWLTGAGAFVFSTISLADKPFGVLYVRPTYGVISDLAVVAAIYFYLRKPSRAGEQLAPNMQKG